MTGVGPFWIEPSDRNVKFPNVTLALKEPNGLLAVGGNLTPRRLLTAYMQGIFPWYSQGQPILWWSPDPRAVLFPSRVKVSRSLRKELRNGHFEVTLDRAFRDVIQACAQPRPNSAGTWITPEITEAYCHLHNIGFAHSVEAWHEGKLVGGLYGIALGKVFFGESMFSRVTNASKVAFVHLVHQLQDWGFTMIDCQIQSDHLRSLGSEDLRRADFIRLLNQHCYVPRERSAWTMNADAARSRYSRDTDSLNDR